MNMNKQNNEQYASCLTKVPIFSHLSKEAQAGIVDLINVKKFKKEEVVYNAGQSNAYLYVLHSGKIKISRYTEEGEEQVIRVLLPGDFIGQHALFDDKFSEDFAISLEDSVLCVLNGDRLKEYMARYPNISFQIINELNKRLLSTESKLEQFNLSSVEKRVASSILHLSKGANSFKLPFSKQNWASMLGMSQETLSRKLRQFKKDNAIELSGQRGIKILHKKYLEKLVWFWLRSNYFVCFCGKLHL